MVVVVLTVAQLTVVQLVAVRVCSTTLRTEMLGESVIDQTAVAARYPVFGKAGREP